MEARLLTVAVVALPVTARLALQAAGVVVDGNAIPLEGQHKGETVSFYVKKNFKEFVLMNKKGFSE